MPIETGRYCGYCTDESGQLQAFEERFERMTAWQARRSPGTPREEMERQTLDYMGHDARLARPPPRGLAGTLSERPADSRAKPFAGIRHVAGD